jgi:hypothetical protein
MLTRAIRLTEFVSVIGLLAVGSALLHVADHQDRRNRLAAAN